MERGEGVGGLCKAFGMFGAQPRIYLGQKRFAAV